MPFNNTLNNVRTYKNYGLIVEGNTYDPIFTKGWIQSSPNILINGQTCYLDYSHSYDTSDVVYLKRTFGKIAVGNTFYFQDTNYFDPKTDNKFNLGGTLTFQSTLNNGKIVIANIVSGMTPGTNYNFFDKENFLKSPQYTFINTTGYTANYILNSLPNVTHTSFKTMGILGNDLGFEEYIDFSGATGINYGRLQVSGTVTLKDEQELLYILSGITSQSLINNTTLIKHYIRGSSSVEEIQQPESVLGIYRIHDESNKLIECYENQNYYQTFLRKQILGSTYSGYWVQCETCPNDIYGENISTDGVQSNLLFDNNVFLFINQISRNVATSIIPTTSYGVFTQRLLTGTPQSASRLSFSVSVGLKIDLSHASLQGWDFQIYIDPNYTIPLTTSMYISGKPGYDQSYVLIKNNQDVPRTLYCKLVGFTTLTMVFNI
jgi:hypothetical protein